MPAVACGQEVNWIRESCLDQSNYLMRSASGSQEVSEVKCRYIDVLRTSDYTLIRLSRVVFMGGEIVYLDT